MQDAQADRATVSELAASARLIHFAGHAVSNARAPELSFLILAGSEKSEAYFYGGDIAELKLDQHPLVVLSACSTAAGRTPRGEAPFSLAMSFIRAGARSVVASLWPIEDAQAQGFFEDFYAAGPLERDAATALRRAVLLQKKSTDPAVRAPSSWGAFQVMALEISSN